MPHIIVNQNEYLAHATHSGGGRTKGSKNGVRRWQNLDGTLTEAGKIHYGQMYGWGKNVQDYGQIANQAKNVGKSVIDKPNSLYKEHKESQIKKQKKEEAKTMSDAELSAIVKRINLEKKYVDATMPEVKSGADKAMQALEIVGAVATTAIAVGKLAEMYSAHKTTKHN